MNKLNCILLVDDNVDDNYFHTLIIQDVDAAENIITATNGEKGIEYLQKSNEDPHQYPFPDLIFLDINMPRVNGFEFLSRAREQGLLDSRRTSVIIMLTSSLNPGDLKTAQERFQNEITEYRTKPLTREMLEEIMSRIFRK
jgi:CheY-like chemotaxis protein